MGGQLDGASPHCRVSLRREAIGSAEGGRQRRQQRQLVTPAGSPGQLLDEAAGALEHSNRFDVGGQPLGLTGRALVPGEGIVDLPGAIEVGGHLTTHRLRVVRMEGDQSLGDTRGSFGARQGSARRTRRRGSFRD